MRGVKSSLEVQSESESQLNRDSGRSSFPPAAADNLLTLEHVRFASDLLCADSTYIWNSQLWATWQRAAGLAVLRNRWCESPDRRSDAARPGCRRSRIWQLGRLWYHFIDVDTAEKEPPNIYILVCKGERLTGQCPIKCCFTRFESFSSSQFIHHTLLSVTPIQSENLDNIII